MSDSDETKMDEANEAELLDLWKEGNEDAAEEIVNRYLTRLIALARTRLSSKLRRRVDPEDVVQSAYRSFFRHAADDRYILERSGDLWRLLAAIVMNKLHGQVEFHSAKKRSIRAEESQMLTTETNSFLNPSAFLKMPTTDEMLGVTDELQRTMKELPSNYQRILELRLQGNGIPEIAKELECSERTVRRALKNVRELLSQRLLDESR